ncbi:MAG: tRNA lysidine(34) synthetase TilS [Paludibacteraceae bacterium]|nr:tRNA lysidine(34) synthetase TilS [Paludibacteraceae bacterium]MEE1084690.1 tRNA lysidine(34) synthetase TilS [Paludibacteraceae bacterium]
METKVKQFIEKEALFTRKDKILIGVSGGRDSIALLHVLYRLGYDIVVAHCNFHLRGEESNRDSEFVTKHVQDMDVPFYSIDFDTELYARQNKISIEMAARELRYEWFDSLLKLTGCKYIAVAHHADDVVETFLINMTRGTGLHGLTGIKAKNGNIVRPFLRITRNDINDYIYDNGFDYVEDSTNSEVVYVRNKVRNIIIPALETINPSFRSSTIQSIENLTRAQNFVMHYVELLRNEIVEHRDGMDVLDLEKIRTAPEPIYVLYEILKPYGFSASTVYNIFTCIFEENVSGKQFYSASGVRALRDRDKIFIQLRKDDDDVYADEPEEYEIRNVAAFFNLHLNFMAEIFDSNSFTIVKDKSVCCIDYKKLTFPLVLRKWKQADSFCPFGMKGRKKLSDFFVDQKFSLFEKENTWVLTDGKCGDIIWVVGHRTDNRFRIDEQTKQILRISFLKQ